MRFPEHIASTKLVMQTELHLFTFAFYRYDVVVANRPCADNSRESFAGNVTESTNKAGLI
jgi:hypothetical protein